MALPPEMILKKKYIFCISLNKYKKINIYISNFYLGNKGDILHNAFWSEEEKMDYRELFPFVKTALKINWIAKYLLGFVCEDLYRAFKTHLSKQNLINIHKSVTSRVSTLYSAHFT